ncbi:MAG: hypothetical protein ACE37I_17160 [Rubinisphaera brasiliensis]|uniref:hypothetical protein n=1 Tax=Rubinisphaera brasiliensis TaxID=119 RepID=UPI00391D8897
MTWTRRNFLASGAAFAFTAAAGRSFALESGSSSPEIAVFTKSFQSWSIDEVCRKFAQLGLSGLDLTVRPGGHIQPNEIKAKLPEAAKIAADNGVKIVQITSAVTDDGDYARDLFLPGSWASTNQGDYRSGKLTKPLIGSSPLRRVWRPGQVAADSGVMPVCTFIPERYSFSRHVGLLLLQDFIRRKWAFVDMLHMSVRKGAPRWQQGLGLLKPWIKLCAVKNYIWEERGRDKHGQQKWKWETCPLADGISPIPDFVSVLKSFNYNGPYSLHSEYLPRLDVNECYQQTAADLEFFRPLVS